MKDIIFTENIPIKLWIDDIEDSALKQVENLANLPSNYHYVRLPCLDGMSIGGGMAVDNG